jgi:hypothetical protein
MQYAQSLADLATGSWTFEGKTRHVVSRQPDYESWFKTWVRCTLFEFFEFLYFLCVVLFMTIFEISFHIKLMYFETEKS